MTRRIVQLFAGLILYGVSMGMMVRSGLGLNPWDVLHQGLSETTGLSFGWIVVLIGVAILIIWIPLRQKPGFGTVANVIVIGVVIDLVLAIMPAATGLPARIGLLVGGILLNGAATGLYIGSNFGPGPRDGLMTGLNGRFPRLSIRVWRTAIELAVLGTGWLLGGTVGIGTVAYALAIGPLAQYFLKLFTIKTPASEVDRVNSPDR